MITLSVPDISCGHCKMSIEGAVKELPGISHVEVHVDTKTVDVEFTAPADRDGIVEAIEEQGYAVAAG